jgi:transcriptional regulator of aromatic amino acid metabolism
MTLIEPTAQRTIAGEICAECAGRVSGTSGDEALLEAIAAPVLLLQGNPRQVVTANQKALALFGKGRHEVENHRGGQVFDCLHSFTEAGCGKDVHCEKCTIKNAIVDTFTTANSHHGVAAGLPVKKAGKTTTYVVQVSTEKLGDFALVRIERYAAEA